MLCAIALLTSTRLPAQEADARSFGTGRWIETARIADAGGLKLRKPELLAATRSRLYVFDYAGMLLRSFDYSGKLLWAIGGPRSEGGEFLSPSDLKLTPDGGVVVLDSPSGRATFVDSTGKIRARTPLASTFSAISSARSGRFVGVPLASALAVEVDRSGNILGRAESPAGLKDVPQLARESLVAEADSSEFVVAFRWSTRMYVITQDLKRVRAYEQLSPMPFPGVVKTKRGEFSVVRVDPQAREVVRGIAMTTSHIVILRAVRDDTPPLVDLYSRGTGAYSGSRWLPARAIRVAAVGERLVGLVASPAPAIYVWEWQSAASRDDRKK